MAGAVAMVSGAIRGRASPVEANAAWRLEGLLVLAVCADLVVAFGFTLASPMPKQPFAQLDSFLEGRKLDVGIGDYWSASITTVATAGAVTVRPVISTPAGRVVRYQTTVRRDLVHESVVRIPRLRSRQAVGNGRRHCGLLDVRPVARTHVIGPYRVLVWRHPLFVPGRCCR
ncbi:MAG TPA: hypothetical protein VK386_06055 [Acidimicrobiales bacterium]|nr:hypothetical protein [Acidimicrobiales bacterium]